MKRPYLIWNPEISRRNGPRVLQLLAVSLKDAGCDVYRYVKPGLPKEVVDGVPAVSDDDLTDDFRQRAVVVYPEVIAGNPLRIQNVVRWILFYPGKNGGAFHYYEGDVLFSFQPQFYPGIPQLTPPWIDQKLFFDDGRPKTQNCCFVHKGGRWRDVPETEGLPVITMQYPATREGLAELLRSTHTLYSFDDCSSVMDEAQLCGTLVKVVTREGFREYESPFQQAVRDFPTQLKYFIEVTSDMDWKGPLETRFQWKAKLNSVWLFLVKPCLLFLSRFVRLKWVREKV